MMPDTCVPTSTLFRGLTVPVAVIDMAMASRANGLCLVLHSGILAAAAEKYRRGYDRHDRHGY